MRAQAKAACLRRLGRIGGQVRGLARMVEAQKSVGAITGDIDLNAIIDTRLLPDDLKTPMK